MKRKLQNSPVARKLRSTLPRRRRPDISPIIVSGKLDKVHTTASSPLSLLSTDREASSRASVIGKNSPAKSSGGSVRRIVTRLYSKRRENEVRENSPSCVDSSSNLTVEKRDNEEREISEFSCVESSSNKQNELSTAEFPVKTVAPADSSDLVCTELLLCDEDQSDYSSAFSDLKSDVFGRSSSEYMSSIWLESGSEFSERSVGGGEDSSCNC